MTANGSRTPTTASAGPLRTTTAAPISARQTRERSTPKGREQQIMAGSRVKREANLLHAYSSESGGSCAHFYDRVTQLCPRHIRLGEIPRKFQLLELKIRSNLSNRPVVRRLPPALDRSDPPEPVIFAR